jgi:hypothetical protein
MTNDPIHYLGPTPRPHAKDAPYLEGMAHLLERGLSSRAVASRFGVSDPAVRQSMRKRKDRLRTETLLLVDYADVLKALAGLHNANS